MKTRTGILLGLLMMAAPLVANAQAQEPSPLTLRGMDVPADSWVQYVGPATATVVAGKPTTLTLPFKVKSGFHINSHKPTSDLMVATRLGVLEPEGLNVSGVDFPPGQEYAFSFDPKTKLSVYTGDFTLTAHLLVKKGMQKFSGLLKYQACDHAACYPPKSLPFVVELTAK
jgi:hypothetical protein